MSEGNMFLGERSWQLEILAFSSICNILLISCSPVS